MSKILNFIVSLFRPTGLKGYKNISGFVAVMIFLLEINLLYLPIKGVLLRKVDDNLNNNAYTIIFSNIEDTFNEGIDGIKNSDYYLVMDENYYKLKTKDTEEQINVYDYDFSFQEQNYKVTYVFDVKGVSDNEISVILDKFLKLYPEHDKTLASYISMILYTERIETEEALSERMKYYAEKTTEDITNKINSLTYFDLYNVEKTDKSYLLVFFETTFLAEVPSSTEGQFARMASTYDNIELDMDNINNINQFSKLFAHRLGERLAEEESVYYLGTCLMYVLLYPIILAGIFNLCLKHRGSLKTFKEFYNVLSMISIAPALLGFIVTFFIGTGATMIYSAALTIYSFIMIYKVIRVEV